jgi:hypothetical protein
VRPAVPPASRRAPLLIGVVFLAAAAGWAWYALKRTSKETGGTVRVKVVDLAGTPVPGATVRTRYSDGGAWVGANAAGEAVLESPRVNQGIADPAAALADALEARATFHAMRHGRLAEVTRAQDGTYDATLKLEHCGVLRLALAMTAFADASARLDPDPARERLKLLEGRDVVRVGEAASWAVFPGAEKLWVTVGGHQGVAQHRVALVAPGPGFLLEKTLFPGPARPIRGFVTTQSAPGTVAATLAGVLEVDEVIEGGERIPRDPVRVLPDGWFSVDYTGEGRFVLQPRLAFADTPTELIVRGGDGEVRLDAVPRPWIEVRPADLAKLAPAPVISLFTAGGSKDVLPENGVYATDQGLRVALPGPGVYVLSVAVRGNDAAPPRAGEAQVTASSGPVEAQITLAERPSGTLGVALESVPKGGGDVRVLPDRARTVLTRPKDGQVAFANVPVGRALVAIQWRDPDSARQFLTAEVVAGKPTAIRAEVVRGGRVEWDATGTPVEDEARGWALRIPVGTTPYGPAEGTLPLTRRWTAGALVLSTDAALKPGTYRAEIHSTAPGGGAALPVTFDVKAGQTTRVSLKTP